MQNAKKAERDNEQCLPDYATSPNHAYLKNNIGTLGYLFYAYWATNGDERGFQNIGLPNPVFAVENSATNNPIHTTPSKSVHTTCITA